MKIYCLGEKAYQLAPFTFPEDEYELGDFFKTITAEKPERRNNIFTLDLVNVNYGAAVKALIALRNALTSKGTLHIAVPSLEWIAEQILIESTTSPIVKAALWGDQRNETQLHFSGYTMQDLRTLLDRAGLKVEFARERVLKDGDNSLQMHYVRCRRD